MTALAGAPLVGRDDELRALDAIASGAARGRGGLALVAGEPGIGKSRLVAAAAESAAAAGARVLSGRAWEAGGAPAYWPWIEALRELFASADPTSLVDDGTLAVLAELLPELRDVAASAPPALDPARARFRLFEAIATLLRAAARTAPILVVLDDLHAADVPSLQLLELVARATRQAPIAVVAAYREVEARLDPARSEIVARLGREGTTLALRRLGPEAVALLSTRALGDAGAAFADSLYQRSEGLPLHVVEMLRFIGARGDLPAGLPETVRAVIGERLRLLRPETRDILDRAAPLGRDVDIALLAESTGRSVSDVRAGLAAALDAEVLVPRDARRLAFSHIAIRDALYAALPSERRAEIHQRIASALGRRAAADPRGAPLAELAHHALGAVPLTGAAPAVEAARRAAAQALESLAFEDATALVERALELDTDDVSRCDLLVDLARSRARSGALDAAREACLGAAALARKLGDAERLARTALAAGEQMRPAIVDRVLIALLRESLEALPTADSSLRATVLARLASAEQPAPDPRDPMNVAREAIEMARRIGDDATKLTVLHWACAALTYFAAPEERAPLHREIVELARRRGDREREARAHLRLVFDWAGTGEIERADLAIDAYEALATELGHPVYAWYTPLLRGMRALMRGRFAEAAERLEEGSDLARRAQDPNRQITIALFRTGLLRAAGTLEDLAAHRPILDDVLRVSVDPPYRHCCLVGIDVRLGRTAAIREELSGLEGHLLRGRPMVAWVAEAAPVVGDPALIARIEDALRPYAHHNHVWGILAMVCEGPMAHPLGILAAAAGRIDEASARFEDAIGRARRMDAPPLAAFALLDHARALAAAGQLDAAARRAGEARAIADELGMPGLHAALDALGRTLPGSRPAAAAAAPRPAAAASLPAARPVELVREGEVWLLRAEGVELRLRDSRGMQILATLVAHPDREHHVLDLAREPGATRVAGATDAGEAIDRTALEHYRARVEELREEIEEAESFGDPRRVERARTELEAIEDELARSVGLGSRPRRAGSSVERARINIQRRLKDAVQRIAKSHPALGRHLDWALRTGTFCAYHPSGKPGLSGG